MEKTDNNISWKDAKGDLIDKINHCNFLIKSYEENGDIRNKKAIEMKKVLYLKEYKEKFGQL